MGPRTTMAAAIAAAIVLAAPEARALDPSCPYGVNAHQASDAALDKVAAAGIGWVRFDMNWLQFEPSKGSYNWTEADRFVTHAASLGLNVFVTVAYTPSWAVGAACNDNDPNDDNKCLNAPPAVASDYSDFLTVAVNRYKADVKAWGMWNEPNLKHFYRGSRDQYVNDILVPGSNAVHAACADCQVMGPELSGLRGGATWDRDQGSCIGSNCIFNGWNYSLRKVLEAAAGSIDVVTHHTYKDPAATFLTVLADGTFEVVKVADGVKEVTDELAPGKPVWITEFGWEAQPSGSHSDSYAAAELSASYQGMVDLMTGSAAVSNQPWPELDKLFWYDLHDDPNGFTWGLMTSGLSEKPQYTAYQSIIATLGDCSGPWSPPSGSGGGASSGVGGGGGSASASGGATSGASSGLGGGSNATTTGGGGGPNGVAASEDDGGCACRSVPSPSGRRSSGWLVGLLAFGLMRRRRGRPATR